MGDSSSDNKPIVISPKVESYRIWCAPLSITTGVPIEFALSWMQKESGGNPCAWGTATQKGPDGHPREQGLGQLYNPDDFKRFGIPSGAFRVYCIPGTQKCSRELTPTEIAAQVKALYQLIQFHRSKAEESVRKNGLRWSGRDFWRLVKLDHALPGLMRRGVAAVTVALGRPPRDWYEFKSSMLSGKVRLDPGTEKYRAAYGKWLNSAESFGDKVPADEKGPSV